MTLYSYQTSITVIPSLADGGMVTIADGIFADGLNVIELIVTYDNGQSHIVVMTYEIERQNSTPGREIIANTATFAFENYLCCSMLIYGTRLGNKVTEYICIARLTS